MGAAVSFKNSQDLVEVPKIPKEAAHHQQAKLEMPQY
jgi:hypothetical protein